MYSHKIQFIFMETFPTLKLSEMKGVRLQAIYARTWMLLSGVDA